MAFPPNNIAPFPTQPVRAAPTRFFFNSGQSVYTRPQIDRMISTHGPNILVGQHHSGDQSGLAYARSRGARIHWYMVGSGEPARGYNNDGRVAFPSDQEEIRRHTREMNMTREQWDNGGWLQWHMRRLIEARNEERQARAEGREPRQVLPDTVEFDSINNRPDITHRLMAEFSRWRQQNGIHTQIVPKNSVESHLAEVQRRLTQAGLPADIFAPIRLWEEYVSQDYVNNMQRQAPQGTVLFRTLNTHDYRSPEGGYQLPANLAWSTGVSHVQTAAHRATPPVLHPVQGRDAPTSLWHINARTASHEPQPAPTLWRLGNTADADIAPQQRPVA